MTLQWAAVRWLLLASFVTSGASAQTTLRRNPRIPAPSLTPSTLRTHLGVDVAQALLKDQDPEQRQRGFERLGSIGTAQALDVLLKAFDTGGSARSAKDRLVAVRALAKHAAQPSVDGAGRASGADHLPVAFEPCLAGGITGQVAAVVIG